MIDFETPIITRYSEEFYTLYADEFENIVKSSPNIIDLIEVGDYVNGRKVYKNDENDYLYLIGFDADGDFYEDSIKDIESIVTKEMFEQMEYKIESEVN